jgi:hypothetical protein
LLLEGCTSLPKRRGRPRFRTAAGPPGDFVTAPIAGRSLAQLGSSCSASPRGNVRRHSGFLPFLSSGSALGSPQPGGLLAVPEGSAVFPRPLASNAPCGNRWSGGLPVTPRKTLRSAFTLVGWASCSAPKSNPFDGHPAAAPLRVDRKKLLSVQSEIFSGSLSSFS